MKRKAETFFSFVTIPIMLFVLTFSGCAGGPEVKGEPSVKSEDQEIQTSSDENATRIPNTEGYYFIEPDELRSLLVTRNMPGYPVEARKNGYMADLSVQLYFAADGSFEKLKFVKTNQHFEEAVSKAVSTWKIKPYQIDDNPVPVFTTYNFHFSLQP
jgi:outer membrane biosynthesis protein TonB